MIEKSRNFMLVLALALGLLAGALRFHSLGAWPFSGDETSTVLEERVLFHSASSPDDSQEYRLPHLIPVGYFFQHVSHTLFGQDEWGWRVVVAALGLLSVVIVFLLLDGPMPRVAAFSSALLVALLPQHVYHSQENRFYIVAAFFSFACLLVGGRVLYSRRAGLLSVMACILAFLAALTHTISAMLLPLVFVAICCGSFEQRKPLRRSVWLSFLGASVVAAVFYLAYLRQKLLGWNQTEAWGYSPLHSFAGSVATLGWSVALLAALGFFFMLRQRTAENVYWLVCFLGWIAASFILPLVVVYHREYLFPLVLAGIVPAGYAISCVYDLIAPHSRAVACIWVGLMCVGNLPGLASHFVDGSRRDERSAIAYVREHWQAGDRLTGYAVGILRFYGGGCCEPMTPLDENAPEQLEKLGPENGRLWIVVENNRWGLDSPTQNWLFDCAAHKLSVAGRRFDEADYRVEVYLSSAPLPPSCRPKT